MLGLWKIIRHLFSIFFPGHVKRSELLDALNRAAAAGKREEVKVLLQRSKQEGSPQVGFWALNHAAQKGHIGAVLILLEEGIRYPAWAGTPLQTAAVMGNLDFVRALLDYGENVNATTSFGISALMSAAAKGRTEVVELLLARGADVNLKTQKGDTAYSYAQRRKHRGIMEMLLNVR